MIRSIDLGMGKALKEDLIVYNEVLSVTQVLTTATKIATQRAYPQHYQMSLSEHPTDEGGRVPFVFLGPHGNYCSCSISGIYDLRISSRF